MSPLACPEISSGTDKAAPSQGGLFSGACSAPSSRDCVPGCTTDESNRSSAPVAAGAANSSVSSSSSTGENSRNSTILFEWEGVTSILNHRQDRNHDDEPIIYLKLENEKYTWANLAIAVLCNNKSFLSLLRNYSKTNYNLFETQDDWIELRKLFNEQCNQCGLSSGASVSSGEDGSYIPSENSDGSNDSNTTGSDE